MSFYAVCRRASDSAGNDDVFPSFQHFPHLAGFGAKFLGGDKVHDILQYTKRYTLRYTR